jgi:hypothetical protein
MPARLEEFFGRLESSQLISYVFENKELRFQLYHPGTGRLVSFFVPTDTIQGRSISSDVRRSTGSISLIELVRRLEIRHDRYIPPSEYKLLLADAADRVMLAYGRRVMDCQWLLSLRGEYPLLSCLVRDPAEIRWTVE